MSCDGCGTGGQWKEAVHPVCPLRGVRRPLPFPLGPTAERSGPLAADGGRGGGGGADHGVAVGRELLAGADDGLRREAVQPARRLVQEQDGGGATRRGGGGMRRKGLCGFSSASKQQPILIPYKHKTGQNHASIAYVRIAASFARGGGGKPAHKTKNTRHKDLEKL